MKRKGLVLIMAIALLGTACVTEKRAGSDLEFNQHLTVALKYFQQENYPAARQELNLALSIDPRSIRANNLMGLTYFKEKNYDLAETYFLKTIKADPQYATGYLNLGAIYAMKESYPKARGYYEKAIAISPDLAAGYYSLATICFQLNDKEQGLDYLKKGLELDPNYLEEHSSSLSGLPMKGSALADLYFNFARVYASRGEVERTVEYLKKARQNGFRNWKLIEEAPEFSAVRDNPQIQEFLK
jgi:tetratricopeptide (TPR) repeat protein